MTKAQKIKTEKRRKPNKERGKETMRKTKKNTLAAGTLVALLLTGCETRIDNPHSLATAALTQRKAYLLERERRRLRNLLRPDAMDKPRYRRKEVERRASLDRRRACAEMKTTERALSQLWECCCTRTLEMGENKV